MKRLLIPTAILMFACSSGGEPGEPEPELLAIERKSSTLESCQPDIDE